ncbi:MFS transporter [Hafnia alvei]|uniref:MFS transporter n=1 Tax=Hafnia alvei TaxID=569 RepID=UPI002DBE540D|nr:MFS transporter [Hafnia alvei]MEB7891641.1 MFS transporter [Hafnia alvei]
MSLVSDVDVGQSSFKGNDRLTLGMVFGVLTFWLFAQSMVNIIPAVRADIDIPLESLNLAVSLSALFSGCFIVVIGGLADTFGRVKMTYIGFILSILGCLCLILAQGTLLFTFGRIIQGLSAACIMPATLALIKTYYAGSERQRALSFWSIGSWGGSGLCSLAGGAIATYLGWKWIFIFSIIFSVVGMLLIRGTPESKIEESQKQPFDYSGLISFVIALISLNLVITKGAKFGWTSAEVGCLLVIFVVSLFIFFRVEQLKKERSFIDFALFDNRPYTGASFSNFMLNAVAGTLLVASIYVQQERGFTAFQSGALTIGYLIAVLGMIRVGEKILQKVGAKKPMVWGMLTTGIGVAIMALTFLPNTTYVVVVFVGYILFGLGLGFYATPSTDTAISSASADKIGVASGIYKMASSLGGAFGMAISASVYTALLPLGGAVAASAGLLVNVAFCVLAILSIMLMVPENAGKHG